MTTQQEVPAALTYIDLFAGCGGLSLGLSQAGWEGIMAVERSEMAFRTLNHNLIEGNPSHFPLWPEWFPKRPCSIQKLTQCYRSELTSLRGRVLLIAGGPPCQGFSDAGKRRKNDHRNQLYRYYLDVVSLVQPPMVLIENVKGITRKFGGAHRRGPGRPRMAYSQRIKAGLELLGYRFDSTEMLASDFGVPQTRSRFVAVGIADNRFIGGPPGSPLGLLASIRKQMLMENGLPLDHPVSCRDAISDLEWDQDALVDSPDTKGYKSGRYAEAVTSYQRLMRGIVPVGAIADSHRYVKHRPDIIARFRRILSECPRGINIPDTFREQNGINKGCIVPLDPEKPAVTLTTIPDDMIHYSQPRVLTVRESARIQSFPDWFEFKSKYTTGGTSRKKQCPRYTQIGNAVPPLMGEALGRALSLWAASSIIRQETPPAEVCKSNQHVA